MVGNHFHTGFSAAPLRDAGRLLSSVLFPLSLDPWTPSPPLVQRQLCVFLKTSAGTVPRVGFSQVDFRSWWEVEFEVHCIVESFIDKTFLSLSNNFGVSAKISRLSERWSVPALWIPLVGLCAGPDAVTS